MTILYKRKRIKFNEFFKSIVEFEIWLKENYNKLNFISPEMQDKIIIVYNEALCLNEVVQYTRFTRRLFSLFKFKCANYSKNEFWLERGWSKEEIENKKLSEKKSKNILTLSKNQETEFRFRNVIFKSDIEPVCQVCNSKLKFRRVNINNTKEYYYNIENCLNENCLTNRKDREESFIEYRAFLPDTLSIDVIKKLKKELKERNHLSIEYWINKGLTKEESINKISETQTEYAKNVNPENRVKITKEFYKEKGYTEEEIEEKCLVPSQIKFWGNKGFSESDAKVKVSSLQKENSDKFQIKLKNNPEIYSARTPTQIYYWTNKGLSKTEAVKKISEIQSTFSLEKCIEKHGDEKGRKVFTERQNKWQKSLNENGNLKIGYSKVSQELFYELLNSYSFEDRKNVFFATKNNEHKIKQDLSGIWLYDYADLSRMKIIEYNGDEYHGNPKFFEANDYPHPFRKNITAGEMWIKDKIKIDSAQRVGFDVLTIWDSEYKKDKQGTIKKCLEFLQLNKND